ncbi:MAG: DUF1853 family protein [Burkholderiaceae bacterium]|nr:DUF1853 family protein [Burkholderiaceae bacterium]
MGDDAAQTARELRWLLLSPPLLDTAPGAHPAAVQEFSAADRASISEWLDVVECDPAVLFDFVHASQRVVVEGGDPQGPTRPRSLRLGRRAERLMAFFLRHGPTHRLVAANIPLRHVSPLGDRTTVGEIDFLLHDSAGHAWHWELAVKFFLCTATGSQATAADFIGPDRAETFDTKLHKMFDRQLRHLPPPPWDAEPWTAAACTRGRLFYRHGGPVPVMPGLHPDHLQGRWIERERLGELPSPDQPVWHLVPRNDWMCPRALPTSEGQDLSTLARFIDEGRPGLATMVMRGDIPGALPVFVLSPT